MTHFADPLEEALAITREEVLKAIKKFPTWPTDPLHAFAVVGEEVGELQKEVLQMTYEPSKTNLLTIRKEAIQAAAMTIRFLMSLDVYAYKAGHQHDQGVGHDGN